MFKLLEGAIWLLIEPLFLFEPTNKKRKKSSRRVPSFFTDSFFWKNNLSYTFDKKKKKKEKLYIAQAREAMRYAGRNYKF